MKKILFPVIMIVFVVLGAVGADLFRNAPAKENTKAKQGAGAHGKSKEHGASKGIAKRKIVTEKRKLIPVKIRAKKINTKKRVANRTGTVMMKNHPRLYI